MRQGQGFEYELLYTGEGEDGARFLMGLADLQTPTYDGARSGQNAARSAPGRGAVGGQSAPGRGGADALQAKQDAASEPIAPRQAQNAHPRTDAAKPSYPHPSLAAS